MSTSESLHDGFALNAVLETLTRRMRIALRALDRPHVTSLAAMAAVAVPLGLIALAGRAIRQSGNGEEADEPADSEAPTPSP